MICEIICVDSFLCMSHLDIVHMLFAYLHVICILSEHIHIICRLSAVVLDMFLSNKQSWCHPYIISSTLYISYHVQLSFRTLLTQMHILYRHNTWIIYVIILMTLTMYRQCTEYNFVYLLISSNKKSYFNVINMYNLL